MASRLVWLEFSIHSRLHSRYAPRGDLRSRYMTIIIQDHEDGAHLKLHIFCIVILRNSEITPVYDLIVGNTDSL